MLSMRLTIIPSLSFPHPGSTSIHGLDGELLLSLSPVSLGFGGACGSRALLPRRSRRCRLPALAVCHADTKTASVARAASVTALRAGRRAGRAVRALPCPLAPSVAAPPLPPRDLHPGRALVQPGPRQGERYGRGL